MKKYTKRKFRGGMILIFVAVLAIGTLFVMLLWNWLIPSVFSGPQITYWQSLGLLLLSRLLLGGFGKLHRDFHRMYGHDHHLDRRARFELREKMHGMSMQERRDYIRRRMAEKDIDTDRECWQAVYNEFFCGLKSDCGNEVRSEPGSEK